MVHSLVELFVLINFPPTRSNLYIRMILFNFIQKHDIFFKVFKFILSLLNLDVPISLHFHTNSMKLLLLNLQFAKAKPSLFFLFYLFEYTFFSPNTLFSQTNIRSLCVSSELLSYNECNNS
jgi:hypothetical protein